MFVGNNVNKGSVVLSFITMDNKIRKIALVGPVAPWRGGISQYSSQLKAALKKHSSLTTVSFKTLYPAWLYPGDSDKEPEGEYLKDVAYTISIYSPLSLHRAIKLIVKEGCEVAYINWWTILWQPGMAFLAWRLGRKGIKTVYLCHNLFDHDAGFVVKSISQFLIRRADGYVVHSADQAEALKEINPQAKILNTILPIFSKSSVPKKALPPRGRLEIMFFGFIRPYKGLEVLLEAVSSLNDQEVFLTVVGEPWGNREQLLQDIKKYSIPNVELHLRYVDDAEAASYFNRADIIALPYLSATGSAVAALAYGYSKPVIATRVGGLKDAVVEGETGWLVQPNNSQEITDVIRSTTRQEAKKMKKNVKKFCENNSWDNMSREMITLFEPK